MPGILVPPQFGIIIRKAALRDRGISVAAVMLALETDRILDEDNTLLSLGPHFGGDAAMEFVKRLGNLGLTYGDDFLDLSHVWPSWCQMLVALSDASIPLTDVQRS